MGNSGGSPLTPNFNYSYCETDMDVSKFGYIWTIKKFSHLQEATGEYLESSTFSASENDKNNWCLKLFPRGCNEEDDAHVAMFLYLMQEPVPNEISAAFEFSVLNHEREKTNIQRSTARCNFSANEPGWGYRRLIQRDYLMNELYRLLPNDELTLCCEVVIANNRNNTTGNAICVVDTESNRVTDDLGRPLTNDKFDDVVLVAEDKELHAHKTLLGAKSPVFKAMFQKDNCMEENQRSRVVVSDIDFSVLEELIRFIYTGKVPATDEDMLIQLLSAADKYALEDLTAICDKKLSVKLSAKNVAKLIPLAGLHNTNHLKASLVKFMKSHTTDDAVNELWKLLISQHPGLARGVAS